MNRYSLSNADLPKRTDGESVECNNNNNILYHIVTCTIYIYKYYKVSRFANTQSDILCCADVYMGYDIIDFRETILLRRLHDMAAVPVFVCRVSKWCLRCGFRRENIIY